MIQNKTKRLLFASALLFLFLLASCQRLGVDILYQSEPPTQGDPLSSATFSPSVSATTEEATHASAPTNDILAPAATLPPGWMQPPFDQVGFAIDPHAAFSPARGDVYCPLPDGSLIAVTLGWKDTQGTIQQTQQLVPIKKQKATYSFLIPQDVPAQYFYLSAEFNFAVVNAPQPDDVRALFGDKGENLPIPPARMGADSSLLLFSAFAPPYPDRKTANAAIFDRLSAACDASVRTAEWQDGTFVVTLSEGGASNLPIATLLDAAQTAAKSYFPQDGELDPIVILQDEIGQFIAQCGNDLPDSPIDSPAVYISDGGQRYHEPNCRYARGAECVALFVAELVGLTPCRVCH